MTNEELEQKVKRLEEQLTEVRIELLERKANKNPYEVEVPEDIDEYYYVSITGIINKLCMYDEFDQIEIYKRGLAFRTEEEAEKFDKERILINRAKNWAKKYDEGWTPNWKDFDEEKCTVMYNNEDKKFDTYETYIYRDFTKLPVFKSEEIAEQFIEEFGEEIKEVLL